jgi:FolB domain-containing protein
MTNRRFDRILISDLLARGRLGVPDEERARPQDILVNLILFIDAQTAGESDRIEDTVDYSVVARQVLELIEKSTRHTVEALAADIARLCLQSRGVSGVRVRVEKPNRIRFTRAVGVEIERFL